LTGKYKTKTARSALKLLAERGERFVHELPPCKTSPPFAGLVAVSKYQNYDSLSQFLSALCQVLPHFLDVVASRSLVHTVEGEPRLAWQREARYRERVHVLERLVLAGTLLQLDDTVGGVEGQIDEESVSGTLDFVVLEEDVSLEVAQRLIYNVFLIGSARGGALDRSPDG